MPKAALLLGACIAASGCAVAVESQPAWIAEGESIAVVQTREWLFDWEATRQVFMRPGRRELRLDLERCLAEALSAASPRTPVLSAGRFAAALFPDLPARQAPTSPESIRLLLDHPSVQPRVAALNLRYLVYAGGRAEIRGLAESAGCAGGFGAGLCVGFGEWTAAAGASLLVLDLKRGRETTGSAAEKTARGAYMYFLPLLAFARMPHAEEELCASAGDEIVKILRDPPQ